MTLPALIACDVDGTLFDDDERITPRTRDAVRAAVDAGAQFVLATGRPPRWIRQWSTSSDLRQWRCVPTAR